MDAQIKQAIPALIAAVETIMNPAASQLDRQAAHQLCDSFKESSPVCIQCGLVLAQLQYSPILRHFGLQLLEHSIKFRWNSLSVEDKTFLKKSCLELIADGTKGILEEHAHVKDAVSRVAVEIIKREWPQMWPSLLNDLYKLCHKGETQTELVLKILLRLVEDVVSFQNVPTQRRREIMQALTSQMTELFDFFLSLLQQYSTKAPATAPGDADKLASLAFCQVSEAVLQTLSGYLDWVNISLIFMKDGLLLQVLCLLLNRDSLQLYAAECLLIIVSRKGKLEERKPLLILFSEDAMSVIWNAAVAAERSSQDEYYYLFLKRLCQVLTELGKQLCALWGLLEDIKQPPNFSKYLEALLAFTLHPSQMLSSFTQTLWTAFLRHEMISKDPVMLSFIPRLVETSAKTLLKVGFPTQTTCSSCDYARLDFDSDEEFNMFFSKHRNEIAETIRLATLKNPKMTFSFGAQWLRRVLQTPVNLGDHKGSENGNCNLSSPSFLDWDALTVFLESVMNKLMLCPEPKPNAHEGIDLLKNVLKFDTQDPLILSSLLSCISTLFPFLNYTPETLSTVLEKIFSAVIFNIPGQTKGTRSRAVKNVRQHACSGLVKICKQYPELLFPVFDKLYNHIQMISRDPEQLSQMEKCILTEALILISNQFHNFEKQSAFVEEVLRPVKDHWLSAEFKEAFWSPEKFMSYVGLDQPPVEPSSADTCGINRSHITYCINTILAVMKRAKWPDNSEVAQLLELFDTIMSKSNKNSENFTASFTTIKHSTVTDMFTDASNSTSVREDIGANKRIQPLGRDNFDIACAGIGVALIPCIMFGNCLVLIAVYKFKRLQTITNVFVVSLAVADLLISIITLPSYVAFYLFPTELATNKYACLMKFSSVVMLMGSSLINLVFVTIDRYIAIVYPLQYVIFMTMRKTKITVFLIWAYNFTIGLLPFVWNVWTPDSICNFYRVLPKSYTIFTTFFMGGLCLILLCLLYARIFYVKSALTKRQKNFLGSVTSAQFQAKDHKSANLFAVIFFVFLICWIPFLVTGSLNYQSNPEIELIMKIVKNFALLLAMSNSALNPIIYCWIRQEFRKGFRRILCRYNGEKLTPGSSMFSINSMQYKM